MLTEVQSAIYVPWTICSFALSLQIELLADKKFTMSVSSISGPTDTYRLRWIYDYKRPVAPSLDKYAKRPEVIPVYYRKKNQVTLETNFSDEENFTSLFSRNNFNCGRWIKNAGEAKLSRWTDQKFDPKSKNWKSLPTIWWNTANFQLKLHFNLSIIHF